MTMGARGPTALAIVIFGGVALVGADAAPVSKPIPFVSVASGRNLEVSVGQFSDITLFARSSAQLSSFTRYLPRQSEPRERLQQLDFVNGAIIAIARGLPDGRAIRIVRVVRRADTLLVSAEIWPIPRNVFVTGTIVFTYDSVKVTRRALGWPLPRKISLKLRKVKP